MFPRALKSAVQLCLLAVLSLCLSSQVARSQVPYGGVPGEAGTQRDGQVAGKRTPPLSTNLANFLQPTTAAAHAPKSLRLPRNVQRFDFSSKLICFTAEIDGREGTFILDTGAPQVLLNNRGRYERPAAASGLGAGGEVALSEAFIKSFVLSGQEYRKLWALSLDLRPLESRLDRSVDGFVGFEVLQRGELRIDYPNEVFQLQKSDRAPRHAGRAPDHTLKFELYGHLPVVVIQYGKRKLRLAIDTGASVNLLNKDLADLTRSSDRKMNVQGLDGRPQRAQTVTLLEDLRVGGQKLATDFVLLNLDDLNELNNAAPIDGILGSDCLSAFILGLDYQRKRVHFWNPLPSK